ncbi:carbonic anhydrase [Nostoc sp. FACHB-152]|uniref:carbonic anhydrase n=1 Tax=unclassified Nostoc TaxID=2593658 RepID=UPI001687AA02|nr:MULTISPECIES: carbonic anhydrase [unclassified Nostoc]MBD2447493.1 carbonic anhydrase [Nostoc sp. FACHB-152]MBD2468303.1 carbonic anhydrase [Nostoc sp. FACHB-145]
MARINGFIGRRDFLKFVGSGSLAIAATAISGSLIGATPKTAIADVSPVNPNPVNSNQALQLLLDGNQRFIQYKRQYPHQSLARLQLVAKAQYPFAAILGCADSRVPAEMIFDQGLGDLFVVRVAGNVASDMAIGSLEYTTTVLGTQLIVVLGHTKCGAVAAAIANEPLPGRIGYIVESIKPAFNSLNSTDAVIANVQYQAKKLQQNSTILAKLIQAGKLKIVGACYDIETGQVNFIT